MSELLQNYHAVRERIEAACARAGRDPSSVCLVAVSKTKPVSMIRTLYDAGVRVFGENRPQELRDKIPCLPADIQWHMIGQLQKNKIKYVIGKAALIHSVDSLSLAEAIQEEAEKRQISAVPVLLEINVAGEDTKTGIPCSEAPSLVREAARFSRLRIRGLMTVAPFVPDAEENRSVFRALKELSVDIASQNIDNVSMNVLSMGMTNDFEIAIEEGATCVRVGTALFGARGSQ